MISRHVGCVDDNPKEGEGGPAVKAPNWWAVLRAAVFVFLVVPFWIIVAEVGWVVCNANRGTIAVAFSPPIEAIAHSFGDWWTRDWWWDRLWDHMTGRDRIVWASRRFVNGRLVLSEFDDPFEAFTQGMGQEQAPQVDSGPRGDAPHRRLDSPVRP
jgi:hypothetical protein